MEVTWDQALAWRLVEQLLTGPADGAPVDAARRLAGVQAQVMSSAELAIGVRTGSSPDAVRGTLHLLPADELPTWVAALRAKEPRTREELAGNVVTATGDPAPRRRDPGRVRRHDPRVGGGQRRLCFAPPGRRARRGRPRRGRLLRHARRPEGLHHRISRPAGWITPVLIVDGRVAGVWAHERRAGSVTVAIEPLASLSKAARVAAEAHAAAYGPLLGAAVTVRWVEQLAQPMRARDREH